MTVRSAQLPWWFGVPFLLGGLAVIGFGVVLALDELRFGREGASVTGSVVEAVYSPGGSDSGPSYSIRYEFVDPATGRTLRGESDVSEEAFDAADPGDPIEVTYLPAERTKSRVGTPEPQLFIPAAVLGGGLLFSVVGVGLLALTRRIREHGVPSWITVTSESSPAERDYSDKDVAADAILNLFSDDAPEPPPSRAMTDDELRALDARLARQPDAAPATERPNQS